MKIQVSIGKFLIDRLTQTYYELYSSQKLRSPCFYNNVSDVLNVADLVKSQNMSIAPKENNIENFESSKEKYFIKEDHTEKNIQMMKRKTKRIVSHRKILIPEIFSQLLLLYRLVRCP